MSISAEIKQKLISLAEDVTKNAYATYSEFHVGAALLTEDGNIYQGCNVENISYGLTSCAERNAIFSAISAQGPIKIKAIAVANGKKIFCTPCGACRQVINEFGPECTVYYYNGKGDYIEKTLDQLLPGAFDEF